MTVLVPDCTCKLQHCTGSVASLQWCRLVQRPCQICKFPLSRNRCQTAITRAAVGSEDEPERVDIDLLAKQVDLASMSVHGVPIQS